jgi:hypothetical protein
MKFFGGKDSAGAHGPSGEQDLRSGPTPQHRLTLELQRAEKFAAMLAHSRSSQTIEISDYLAGMYICNWEHLSEYWADRNREEVEGLLQKICRISPQRWHSWIEMYDRQLQEDKEQRWHLFRYRKKSNVAATPLQPSAALRAVLEQASRIAPAYDRSEGRSIPILNTECVLLSIVRTPGSEISRKLALTGLDVSRLEREVLVPRRRPRT